MGLAKFMGRTQCEISHVCEIGPVYGCVPDCVLGPVYGTGTVCEIGLVYGTGLVCEIGPVYCPC